MRDSSPAMAKRERETVGRAARVNHAVGVAKSGVTRLAKRAPSARADGGTARVDVHELDVAAGDPRRKPGDEAADGPAADHRDHAIADVRARVPQAVDRGLEIRRQNRARFGRHGVGQRKQRGGWHHVTRLVRVEGEHAAPFEVSGPALDLADARVAVLDRRGKRTGLKRRAHAIVLARRHASFEDERLGPPADPAENRPDDDIA